ncbi:MAG TPA: hypothetical protein VEH02_07400 [Pseudolabrys sp.]|nr:hypothetical protein [Pseudolabrys sp.]
MLLRRQGSRFIEAAVTERLADGSSPIELYALSVDDTIVATNGRRRRWRPLRRDVQLDHCGALAAVAS